MICLFFKYIFLSIFLISKTKSDVCPLPPVLKGFDLTKYIGRWYEIQRFKLINEDNLKCSQANYTQLSKSTIQVNNTGVDINSGAFKQIIGSAQILDPNVPAKLWLTFTFGPVKVSSDYWVLDTDYSTYSLVYDCRISLGKKAEFCWILSRQNSLNQTTIEGLKTKLSSYGIDPTQFLIIDQTNCNKNF